MLKANCLRYLGKCQHELGNFDICEDILIEARETANKLPAEYETEAEFVKSKIEINMSLTLLELNDFDKALEMAKDAVRDLTGEWGTKARLVRGKCFMERENYIR